MRYFNSTNRLTFIYDDPNNDNGDFIICENNIYLAALHLRKYTREYIQKCYLDDVFSSMSDDGYYYILSGLPDSVICRILFVRDRCVIYIKRINENSSCPEYCYQFPVSSTEKNNIKSLIDSAISSNYFGTATFK